MKNSTELPMTEEPLYALTAKMLDCVSRHDFETLSGICDDTYGIIDINTDGSSKIMRNRYEWEQWFKGLFVKLKEMQAKTWSEITRYEVEVFADSAYSVVDFDQILIVGEKRMRFAVIATIIWKKVDSGWKEARYHSSLLSVKEE